MKHEDTKLRSSQREFKGHLPDELERVAKAVINASYAVHLTLGPGLLESVYEVCLVRELELQGLKVERQVYLPIHYADITVDSGLRIDLLVEDCLIVELKAVETMMPVYTSQLLTYLKLSGYRIGLLINFNVPLI